MRKMIFICCAVFGMALCAQAQDMLEGELREAIRELEWLNAENEARRVREQAEAAAIQLVAQTQSQIDESGQRLKAPDGVFRLQMLQDGTQVSHMPPMLAVTQRSCSIPANIEALGGQEAETLDIRMDDKQIKFATGFLSKNRPDEARAAELINDIKYICVRSFYFQKEVQYPEDAIAALARQFPASRWSRVISSKRGKNSFDVFFRMEESDIAGIAVITVEPREFSLVQIDGKIRPEQLNELGAQLGIPQIKMRQIDMPPNAK